VARPIIPRGVVKGSQCGLRHDMQADFGSIERARIELRNSKAAKRSIIA
jgi:hypothetical protein